MSNVLTPNAKKQHISPKIHKENTTERISVNSVAILPRFTDRCVQTVVKQIPSYIDTKDFTNKYIWWINRIFEIMFELMFS